MHVTGNRSARQSSVSSLAASPLTTPPPAYITGRRAFASAFAASRICFTLPCVVGW